MWSFFIILTRPVVVRKFRTMSGTFWKVQDTALSPFRLSWSPALRICRNATHLRKCSIYSDIFPVLSVYVSACVHASPRIRHGWTKKYKWLSTHKLLEFLILGVGVSHLESTAWEQSKSLLQKKAICSNSCLSCFWIILYCTIHLALR